MDVLDLRSCLASIISESIGNKESKEEGASMASEALGKVSERTIKEMCRWEIQGIGEYEEWSLM